MLEASVHHTLGSCVLQLELRGQIGAGSHLGWSWTASLKPGSHAVIGQLRAVADKGRVDLAIGPDSR
jgi:hypothetical protein